MKCSKVPSSFSVGGSVCFPLPVSLGALDRRWSLNLHACWPPPFESWRCCIAALITASSSSAFAPGGGFGGKAFIRSTSALMQSSSGSGAAVRGGLPLLPGPVWSAACLAWLRLGLPSSPHAEVRTRARGVPLAGCERIAQRFLQLRLLSQSRMTGCRRCLRRWLHIGVTRRRLRPSVPSLQLARFWSA